MEEKNLTIEERMLRKVQLRKRKKRNRRIVRWVLGMSCIGLFCLYLVSDMSHVKSITIINNTLYSNEEILKKASLTHDSSYLLTIRFLVNRQLENDPLIKDAKLSKNLHGGFTIYIEEEKVIGYLENDPNCVLVQGKGVIRMKNVPYQKITRLNGFKDEQLKELDKAFEKVDLEVLSLISEIVPHSESHNQEMVQLIMNDGNRVSTSYEGVYLINQYKKILPQLEGTHVCLFMDEYTGNIIKQANDCTKDKK